MLAEAKQKKLAEMSPRSRARAVDEDPSRTDVFYQVLLDVASICVGSILFAMLSGGRFAMIEVSASKSHVLRLRLRVRMLPQSCVGVPIWQI
jgi:hypothetical protein